MSKSKNNPNARGNKTGTKMWNGKAVKPVKFIGGSTYIAAADDSGNMAIDETGNPIPWNNI